MTYADDGLTRVVRLLRYDLDPEVGKLQFAPASLVDTVGEPLLVLSDDVDGKDGQDLVAITEGTGEMEGGGRGGGGVPGSVSTALSLDEGLPGCNYADIADPFGVLDLADSGAFINGFTSQNPIADIDGNGIYDLGDVSEFIAGFVAGYPEGVERDYSDGGNYPRRMQSLRSFAMNGDHVPRCEGLCIPKQT